MNSFRADMHIHSVLSPCGDLEMSPENIVNEAVRKDLDIIAVTDHNHTGNVRLAGELGAQKGIWVVYGAELCTSEEVHCLAYFETIDQLYAFQETLDENIPKVPNDVSLFGNQVIVDDQDLIIKEIEYSLYPGLKWGISETARKVHELEGLFVPAHVDRRMNGLFAQLGIWPEDVEVDGVEISGRASAEDILSAHPELSGYSLIHNSDAHYLSDIGRYFSYLYMEEPNFSELKQAFRGENGRRVEL